MEIDDTFRNQMDVLHGMAVNMAEKAGFSATDEQMDELAGKCREFMDLLIKSGDSSMIPHVAAYLRNKNGEIGVAIIGIMEGGSTFNERCSAMSEIGKKFAMERLVPLCWFYMSEAWIRKVSKEQMEEEAKNGVKVMPRNAPDRIEVLMYGGTNFTMNKVRCGFLEVERDCENNFMVMPKTKWEEQTEAETPLLNALGMGYAMGVMERGKDVHRGEEDPQGGESCGDDEAEKD